MVIWSVSSLRVANKAQERLFASIKRDGGAHKIVNEMQTRAELYDLIGLHEYEAMDASIVGTVVPQIKLLLHKSLVQSAWHLRVVLTARADECEMAKAIVAS